MSLFSIIKSFLGLGLTFFCSFSGDCLGATKLKNVLDKEDSQYLRQHKDNPIYWQTWGESTFTRAKKEQKLIFLSIGYSTCHWCHVMNRKTFSDKEVAKELNENFISIKVDRERRPDIDAIYMDALLKIQGTGGWPISVWLTPTGKPFFAGSYYSKEDFLVISKKMSVSWKRDPKKILRDSQSLAKDLNRTRTQAKSADLSWDKPFAKLMTSLKKLEQLNQSRLNQGQRFPQPLVVQALLRYDLYSGKSTGRNWVRDHFNQVLSGGLHDHISGGFHRYAVDQSWKIPHFEKMLYDNGQILLASLEAYRFTKKPEYRRMALSVLKFVESEFLDKTGGFYSGMDAESLNPSNSKHQEGHYYSYTRNELINGLSKSQNVWLGRLFKIRPIAKGTDLNIVIPKRPFERLDGKIQKKYREILGVLEKLRQKKNKPMIDKKMISGWNGIMIAGLAKSYQVLRDTKYRDMAIKAGSRLWSQSFHNGRLYHESYKSNKAQRAFSEDYALVINGFIQLYRSTFDNRWLKRAEQLQLIQNQLFWNSKLRAFYLDDGTDKNLVQRITDREDKDWPSANSLSVVNLLDLYGLTYNESYKNQGEKILKSNVQNMEQFPLSYPYMLVALDYFQGPRTEVAVISHSQDGGTGKLLKFMYQGFYPKMVMALGPTDQMGLLNKKTMIDGKPTVYICQKKRCLLPTTDMAKAMEKIFELSSSHP